MVSEFHFEHITKNSLCESDMVVNRTQNPSAVHLTRLFTQLSNESLTFLAQKKC